MVCNLETRSCELPPAPSRLNNGGLWNWATRWKLSTIVGCVRRRCPRHPINRSLFSRFARPERRVFHYSIARVVASTLSWRLNAGISPASSIPRCDRATSGLCISYHTLRYSPFPRHSRRSGNSTCGTEPRTNIYVPNLPAISPT